MFDIKEKAKELYDHIRETKLPPGRAQYLIYENALKEAFLAGRVQERISGWMEIGNKDE
jgi:hypothetical protein